MFDRSKSIFFREEQQAVEDNKQQAELHKKLVQTNFFALQLPKLVLRTYGVSIKYYDGQFVNDATAPARRIDYEMEAAVSPHEELNDRYWIAFQKKKLFINRHEPDLVAEELAVRLIDVLNPIRILVNETNQIQNGIANHDEILSNWAKAKTNIQNKYEGELTDKLIEKIELKLSNPIQILYSLEKDMFWKAFFNPIYGIYTDQLNRKQYFDFFVGNKKKMLFEGLQQVRKYKTDYNTYKIEFEEESIKGNTLQYVYDIDVDTGLIKYIVIDYYQNEKKHIRFSAYQTGKDHSISNQDNNKNKVEIETSNSKPKSSFWSFLDV